MPREPETTVSYECQDCIGMADHGCYCMAMGAPGPGGPAQTVLVTCGKCGGDGRHTMSRWGNDPDPLDLGPCRDCNGTGEVEADTEPATMEDVSTNGTP